MAGTITHEWNGSVLTITSDSGTSSANLLGPVGDTGCRGPQGPAGVIYDDAGNLILDMADYATTEYVDKKMENIDVNLDGYLTEEETAETYASKEYVSVEIAKAQMEGAGIDTSGFATKADLAALDLKVEVDNKTIVEEDGVLKTTLGGYLMNGEPVDYSIYNQSLVLPGPWNSSYPSMYTKVAFGDVGVAFVAKRKYHFTVTFRDNVTIEFDSEFEFTSTNGWGNDVCYTDEMLTKTNNRFQNVYAHTDGRYGFSPNATSTEISNAKLLDKFVITAIAISSPGSYVPINGHFIPVDGNTVYLNDEGKLSCSVSIEGGTINLNNYYTKAEIDEILAAGGTFLPSSEEVEY